MDRKSYASFWQQSVAEVRLPQRFARTCASLLGCIVIFSLAACTASVGTTKGDITLISPTADEVILTAEIADTNETRREGLMHRTVLEENHSMLFVFDESVVRWFWMKNTKIPLDVLFFDADKTYVSHQSMVPCTTDVCAMYGSVDPAAYALEVNDGFAEEHGVGEGWILQIDN